MRRFTVSATEYFAGLSSHGSFEQHRRVTETSMQAVIDRYQLAGSSVLSIGCGFGFEEHWFWRSGCRLTLVDLDEHGTIEPYLETVAPPRSAEDTLDFFIGPAQELALESGPFDLCYFSSFTPDEMHRRDAQLSRPLNMGIRALRGINRFVRWMPHPAYRWPADTAPICGLVVSAVDRFVRDGGTLLLQSYYYGVNVAVNQGFIPQLSGQLSAHGFSLEELHYQEKRPDISLLVARRGSRQPDRPAALPTFCGRFAEYGPARRAF